MKCLGRWAEATSEIMLKWPFPDAQATHNAHSAGSESVWLLSLRLV